MSGAWFDVYDIHQLNRSHIRNADNYHYCLCILRIQMYKYMLSAVFHYQALFPLDLQTSYRHLLSVLLNTFM